MTTGTLVLAAILAITTANEVSSLKLTVYYETLCPDSMIFITRQLYPAYQTLSFDVEFVPFGFAASNTNPWSTHCQHGTNECLGNTVQGCVLDRLTNANDQVEFVNCVMSTSYPPKFGEWCADRLNISYDGIEECSAGQEGRDIFIRHGDRTHSIQPGITFIPTIVINDVYDQATQDLALKNLLQAICTRDPTVSGCSRKPRRRVKNVRKF